MSQVDKLNYVPLLTWFVILMIILYVVVFVHFLPLAYSIVTIRTKFLNVLMHEGYGLTTMLLQLVGFVTKISVPDVYSTQLIIIVSVPALLYNYLLIR